MSCSKVFLFFLKLIESFQINVGHSFQSANVYQICMLDKNSISEGGAPF